MRSEKIMRVVLLLTVLQLPAVLVHAKSQPASPLTLAEIRRLVLINVDQPGATPVMVSGLTSDGKKDDDTCLCSCRDQAWSCTDTLCKMHDDSCAEDGNTK